jgi:hypothetical protein
MFTQDGGRRQHEFDFSSFAQRHEDIPAKKQSIEFDIVRPMVVSDMSIRASVSRHIHSFISSRNDYGLIVAHANREPHFPHESDTWLELSRCNLRDMTILCSSEIERWQLDIFSKGHAHLSMAGGTARHVQALDFIPISE